MKRNRSKSQLALTHFFAFPIWITPRQRPEMLVAPDSERCYRFAIDDFIDWYRSKP